LRPENFTVGKVRKLAKNLVYVSLYHRGLLGELRQTFVLGRGIKISASNFGGPSPLKFQNRKT